MEKIEKKMAPDAIMIEVIKTLFIKGGDNRKVATRVFQMYAKFGAFPDEVLEYATGIGLISALSVQAELGYDRFEDASVSILKKAKRWNFLILKRNWQALADAGKWNLLVEHEQLDVLAQNQQWDILASLGKWDILIKYKKWDVLAEYRQWDLLKKHNRWFELLCAGQFDAVPRQALVGYAFMRCFMK